MHIKTTRQLFLGQYQYKIVLVCSGASLFRNPDLETIYNQLLKQFTGSEKLAVRIKTQEDLDYCFELHGQLTKSQDFSIRVESPWITIYSNSKALIDSIKKIDDTKVKYISVPPSVPLVKGTVIMPNTDFDYKVTLGKTRQNFSAFVDWAEAHPKIKMTKSCKKDLLKEGAWGGTHFFITGDNNLLMAKMHLGGSINKVERIIKSDA